MSTGDFNWIDYTIRFLGSLTGIAGVFIAYYVYRLSRQQRSDSWFRSFTELHVTFWQDPDFREVRQWIANPEAYAALDAILAKRAAGRPEVSTRDYAVLEKVDKFFNFLVRAHQVAGQLRGHDDLWDLLFFQYWLDDIVHARRHRLFRYYEDFYQNVGAVLPFAVSKAAMERFKEEATQCVPRFPG